MVLNNALFSSRKTDWETPQDFFEKLNKKFKFDLDAAANDENHKTEKYFTEKNSALDNEWQGNVFVNPPYGRKIGEFVKKAYEEYVRDNDRFIVMLIPARTDTRYWHSYIQGKATVKFIKGRLKFENNGVPKDAAPFPSALVIYGIEEIEATHEI